MIQKPYAMSINGSTIDAVNEDNIIKWQVSGATQSAFSIDIKDNSTGLTIFSVAKTSSYVTQYNLLKGNLTNGNTYQITITAYDELNNSATSDTVIFQTSSRPVVTVNTIGTNGVVANPSYNFSATYSQVESVAMRSYIAFLYDSNGNVVKNSSIQTTTPIQYLVTELQSENNYYIEFQITSDKGLTGTSGKISFSVLYTSPQVNVNLTAKNVENSGIELNWKTVQIIGATTGTTSFPNTTEIDVTNGAVYFNNGFSITNSDFTLKLWIRNPENKVDLLKISGVNGTVKLQYHLLDQKFHLYKTINNSLTTTWESETVAGTKFYVYIQQINNNFNLHAEVIV